MLPAPGHAYQRRRHRIENAALVFLGDRYAIAFIVAWRIELEVLDLAFADDEADFVGFLARFDGRGIGRQQGLPPCSVPFADVEPSPPVNARNRPMVPPLAAEEYALSEMSMSQVPLPIGRPAKVMVYCASRRP